MKLSQQLLAAMLLLLFIACNRAGNEKMLGNKVTNDIWKTEESRQQAPSSADTAGMPTFLPMNNQATSADWDKKIIKEATLTIEVKNYKAFDNYLRSQVQQKGGYIAQEEQNESDYKIENRVTIKVPVHQFDNSIVALTPDNEKVLEKKIGSQDVTGEVIDTKSRMEAKRKVRDRYLTLLQQAKNMEDILKVQNEINDIQEQIEGAEGRIAYLNHSSVMSTIQVTFYQVLNPAAGNINEPRFSLRLLASFKSGFMWVGELLIGFVAIWPLWIMLISAWFIIKRFRPAVVKKSAK